VLVIAVVDRPGAAIEDRQRARRGGGRVGVTPVGAQGVDRRRFRVAVAQGAGVARQQIEQVHLTGRGVGEDQAVLGFGRFLGALHIAVRLGGVG
jgi:hypothetical protein